MANKKSPVFTGVGLLALVVSGNHLVGKCRQCLQIVIRELPIVTDNAETYDWSCSGLRHVGFHNLTFSGDAELPEPVVIVDPRIMRNLRHPSGSLYVTSDYFRAMLIQPHGYTRRSNGTSSLNKLHRLVYGSEDAPVVLDHLMNFRGKRRPLLSNQGFHLQKSPSTRSG